MEDDQKPDKGAPFPIYPVPPEVMEEARRTFNLEEWLAGIEEIQRTGGRTFDEFFPEIEKELTDRQRNTA